MPTDTRDLRAIEQIACPACGAAKGEACRIRQARNGRPRCCRERRRANQVRLRGNGWFAFLPRA